MIDGYGQQIKEQDRLRPTGAPRGSLKIHCQNLAQRYQRRDDRIFKARNMLLGQLVAPFPPKIAEKIMKVSGSSAVLDALRVRLPQGTVVPLKTVNVLQRKRPKLKRARGMGVLKMQKSTHVEKWVNAALETIQASDQPLLNWAKLVELLFNEGEAALLIMPIDAGWERVPGLTDKDGNIRKMYQRDSKGRSQREYTKAKRKDFEPDMGKSRQVYDDTLTDYMARRLPWSVRVIHATDCYPMWGPNDELDGMMVRQVYSRNDLIKRNFRWSDMDSHLSPVDDTMGTYASGPEVTVYEWYGKDENGDIYVLYEVEGRDTWRVNSEDKRIDGWINLTEEYGLCRLPCTYKYGWHFDTKEPQDKGVPFIYPFIQSLLGVDSLATATVFHTWWMSFGGKYYKPDQNLPAEAWLVEGEPRTIEMEPMTLKAIAGDIQDVGNKQVGEDAHRLIGLMSGAVEQEMPGGGGGAFGAGSAQSGLDRSIMRNYLEDSVSQTFLGAREAYEFAGEILLELADKMLEYEEDIDGLPVFANIDPGPKGANATKQEAELIILESGDAGVVYDMTAYFPTKHGEFLAQGQQLAEFVKQELATFEEFREMVFGDEAPEETRIAIYVNRILNSEIGQQYIMELAMEYLGEDKMKRMVKAQNEGQMTEGGTPQAALTGVFPGNPGNVMSGMGRGVGGKQALGGAVSAGLGNRDQTRLSAQRSATGSGPEQIG